MKSAVSTDALQAIRERGADRFAQLGWPTTRLEEWRYTNLAPVSKIAWQTAPPSGVIPETHSSFAGRAVVELMFLNGRCVLRTGDGNKNIRTLADDAGASALEHLGRYADLETHAMTALNSANMQDGAVLDLD